VDVVIISPEKGRVKEIGQRLLSLADSPYQVQWVTWPQAGFSIPLELFAKFDADGEEPEAAEEEAPKRRRRRSKDSTDNNTSEEE
jgi:hypothetical protein